MVLDKTEPLSTNNMAAKVVTRNARGIILTESDIAIPAGLTHEQAVEFVRKYTSHEITGFYTFS